MTVDADPTRRDPGRSTVLPLLLAYQRGGGGFALPVSAKLAVGRKGG